MNSVESSSSHGDTTVGPGQNGSFDLGATAAEIWRQTNTIAAVPEFYPQVDNTGVKNSQNALNAIFASAPFGSRIVLRGIYRIAGLVDIPSDKFLTIDMSAAEIIMAGTGTHLRCLGSFEQQQPIQTISVESVAIENKTRTLTKLTLDDTVSWKLGDIVKVIANDVVPGGHVVSDETKPRVGEFSVVHAVDGNSVYLKGPLLENYSQNPRVARLLPGSVELISPTVDTTDERIAKKMQGTFFEAQNLTKPRIVRATMRRLVGMGISMKSCYGYTVEAPVGHYAMDDTASGIYGYFVHDSSCNYGSIIDAQLSAGRHAYTDGTAEITADSADTSSYGATINTKIIGGTSEFMTAACWDTHHNSLGVEFIDCTARPLAEESAFLLRGRRHRIVNPMVFGGLTLLTIITQVTGTWSRGESFGHELVNPRSFGTARILEIDVRSDKNHPHYGQRVTEKSVTVRGGVHENMQRKVSILNGFAELVGATTNSLGSHADGPLYEVSNGVLIFRDETVVATDVATVGAGRQGVLCVVDSGSTMRSIVKGGRLSIEASPVYIAAATTPVEAIGNTERFDVAEILFESDWNNRTPVVLPESIAAQGSVDWGTRNLDAESSTTQHSSRMRAITNAEVESGLRELFRSAEGSLLMLISISDGIPRSLSKLPPGKFVGQTLTIFRANTGAAVTIKEGTAGGTAFVGGKDKALTTVDDSLTMIWSGTVWREPRAI